MPRHSDWRADVVMTEAAWEAFAWNTPADVENGVFAYYANFQRSVNGLLGRVPMAADAYKANGFVRS